MRAVVGVTYLRRIFAAIIQSVNGGRVPGKPGNLIRTVIAGVRIIL
jgi:hypothetical protein